MKIKIIVGAALALFIFASETTLADIAVNNNSPHKVTLTVGGIFCPPWVDVEPTKQGFYTPPFYCRTPEVVTIIDDYNGSTICSWPSINPWDDAVTINVQYNEGNIFCETSNDMSKKGNKGP